MHVQSLPGLTIYQPTNPVYAAPRSEILSNAGIAQIVFEVFGADLGEMDERKVREGFMAILHRLQIAENLDFASEEILQQYDAIDHLGLPIEETDS